MPLGLARNARREALGERYIEATLDVFSLSEVQDRLGSQADEIASMLRTSYVAPYRHGKIRVPDHQSDRENLALHPLLVGERWHDRNEAEWLRPADRAWVGRNDPDAYQKLLKESESEPMPRQRRQIPRPSNGWRTVGTIGPKHLSLSYLFDEERHAVTSRSLIVVQGSQMPLPPDKMAIAAIIGHETDHAIYTRQEMYGATHADCLRLRGTARVRREQQTRWERRAYEVTYGIAHVAGVNGPSYEELARIIDFSSPQNAAASLHAMDGKYYPSDHTRGSLEQAQFVAAGALALSHIFGDGPGHATPEEMHAYLAARLISI